MPRVHRANRVRSDFRPSFESDPLIRDGLTFNHRVDRETLNSLVTARPSTDGVGAPELPESCLLPAMIRIRKRGMAPHLLPTRL